MRSALFVNIINPFMTNWLFYLQSLDRPISNRRGVSLVLIINIFDRNSCSYANSINPDLRLHCLPMSILWAARQKCQKTYLRTCAPTSEGMFSHAVALL